MRALTFIIRFISAQFKEHTQRLTRRTYFIPPPSTVLGVFGAILGVRREGLRELALKVLAGAEMVDLDGHIVTLARIYKLDKELPRLKSLLKRYYAAFQDEESKTEALKQVQELFTIKESEELYKPEYKFAIASHDEALIEEGLRRLRQLDFEHDLFGGNDYHLVEFVGEPKPAIVEKSCYGTGYCKLEDFETVASDEFSIVMRGDRISLQQPVVIPVMFLAKVNSKYVQVYGAKIKTKREIEVVNDGESSIFIHNTEPFLVIRGME